MSDEDLIESLRLWNRDDAAAHVNETPKTEHDAGNVLTAGGDA